MADKKRKLQIRLSQEDFAALQEKAERAGTGVYSFAKTALITDQRGKMLKTSIEAYKMMCPSRCYRGCRNSIHKAETQTTKCDGNCARIKYLVNTINKIELR